jgi:nucleotidyltransferase/DNA polymerase involved in DNA repair
MVTRKLAAAILLTSVASRSLAMPAVRAERLCPNAVFLPPDFPRYRAVSRQVRDVFRRHTDLIEPLSLDEAYLDVTQNKTGLPTATQVARFANRYARNFS